MYKILVTYYLNSAAECGATLTVTEADENFDKCILWNGRDDVAVLYLEHRNGWDTLDEDVQDAIDQARQEVDTRRRLKAATPGPQTFVL